MLFFPPLLFVLLASVVYKTMQEKTFSLYTFDKERTLSLRAILALLIILHHLAQVDFTNPLTNPFTQWGLIVAGMFFFITGYGLMISYQRKGESYLQGFIKHRLLKILSPCLFATFARLSIQTCITQENAYLQFFSLSNGKTPLPNSWFVYVILLFYLLFFFSAKYK